MIKIVILIAEITLLILNEGLNLADVTSIVSNFFIRCKCDLLTK